MWKRKTFVLHFLLAICFHVTFIGHRVSTMVSAVWAFFFFLSTWVSQFPQPACKRSAFLWPQKPADRQRDWMKLMTVSRAAIRQAGTDSETDRVTGRGKDIQYKQPKTLITFLIWALQLWESLHTWTKWPMMTEFLKLSQLKRVVKRVLLRMRVMYEIDFLHCEITASILTYLQLLLKVFKPHHFFIL